MLNLCENILDKMKIIITSDYPTLKNRRGHLRSYISS